MTKNAKSPIVNPAWGAGRWFPAEPGALRDMLEQFMHAAPPPPMAGRIAAAIAPHAGYVYSGPVAAHVFSLLRAQAASGMAPETIVILGFSHRQAFAGAAAMAGAAIATPLGQTDLDTDAVTLLTANSPLIFTDSRPHQGEHSAENIVPFAQAALPRAKLLPIIIGDHDTRTRTALVDALARVAASRKTLVLASSDMLHDPDYEKVTRTDHATLQMAASMQMAVLLGTWRPEHQIFCGIAAVATAMEFAARQGCPAGTVLHYRNSGDDYPASRGDWVVGYGALVFPATGRG